MKKKKILCSMLLGCFMFCGVSTGVASESNTVKKDIFVINGSGEKEIETIVIDNRKLIPLREVSTLLGCKVNYEDGKILINKETNLPNVDGYVKSIECVFEAKPSDQGGLDWGTAMYYVYSTNGISKFGVGIGTDIPLTVINGTTYCPVRHLANTLNYNVDIDGSKILLTESNTKL